MRIRDSKNLRSILGTVSSEISGIEQLQEELIRSEEKYRTILEEMDQAYYEIDLKGSLIFINDAAARMHGYTRQEMLGMKYKQFMPRQHWKSAVENYSRVLTTGVPMRGYSAVSLKKDGTSIYREDSIFPIRDEKGKIVGLRGISSDVTQHKIAEEALLQEKQFTETVIDSLTGVLFLIDREGHFVRYNRNALEIMGYTAEEAKNIHFLDIVAGEDRPLIIAKIPEVYSRGTADLETRLVTKDGRKLPFYLYARLVTFDGRSYVLGTGMDISKRLEAERARDESEKNYRILAENTSDVVLISDMNSHTLWISESLTRSSGFSLEELQQLPVEKQMTPDSLKRAVALFEAAFAEEMAGRGRTGRYYDIELEVYRKDGSTHWTENRYQFIRDKQGKATGMLMQGRDITDRKLAERARDEIEKNYRLLAENTSDIVSILDLDLHTVWVSSSYTRSSGFTLEDAQTLPVEKLFPPQSVENVKEFFTKAFEDELAGRGGPDRHWDLDAEVYRKDGSTHWLENRLQFIRDEQGKPTAIMMQGRDITDRKCAEQARDESEKNYRLLAENTSDGISIADLNLKTTWISSSIVRRSGYTLEELRDLPLEKQMTPESLANVTALITRLFKDERAGLGGPDRYYDVDLELYRKDGSACWTENTYKFIRDEQGKPAAILMQGRDITARKLAEQARDESERNYRLLAENTTDMVMIMDMDLNINWVTVPNGRSSGYTREEMQNLPIEKQLAPESLKKSFDILVEAFDDEKAGRGAPDRHYDAELEVYSKDGSTFWTENTFKFIRDEQGKAVAMLMQGRDITDRKLAEQARDESERNYRLLAENTTDIISIIDDKLNLVWLSASGEKATGYSYEEQISMPLKKKMTPASVKAAIELWSRALQEENSGTFPPDRHYNIESEYYCKDGSTIWVDTTLRFLRDENGKPLNMLLQGRDITARKLAEQARDESERNYRLLAEHTSDIVTILDTDFNLIWLSASCEKLTGFTFEEQKAMPLQDKLTSESMKISSEIIYRAMQEEKEGTFDPDRHYDIESELYCKDGSTVWTETRVSFIRDTGDKAINVLLQGRDITDRKKAEVALQKTMEDLKRSNEELQRFAYVASHDLQEPLRMVSSYVQLLEKRYKDKLDEDAADFINYAVSGAKRMQNLINDLLAYSRVGTRGKPFAPVDCSEVLYAAVSNLQIAIQENSAVISHDDLPQLVGDEGQLVQLFQNIIGNAVKFHGAEAPEVRIDAVLKGEYWQFSIRDNGIGIEPQYFERIFQVFQRLNGIEYPGTGIGLSIARKIVQRHGGEMWLESQPGHGSTFYFTIPQNAKGEYGI